MRYKILALITGLFFTASNLYAAGTLLVSDKIGIGTDAPTETLEIVNTAGHSTVWLNASEGQAKFRFEAISDTGWHFPVFQAFRGRGTAASPSALLKDDIIFYIQGYGYGTCCSYSVGAQFRFKATEDWNGSSSHGANIEFSTTENSNGGETKRLVITHDGHLEIVGDNKGLVLGAGKDATIYYNGTDMVIDPDVVGSGALYVAGDMDVDGAIYQRGGSLHADYVFEPDYNIEPIEMHSEYMWQNKHLMAIPKGQTNSEGEEVVEIGAHQKGIVEELEKAHVYIEQLNGQMKVLMDRLTKLEKTQ